VSMTIDVCSRQEPVRFAARELARYLRRATRRPVRVTHGGRQGAAGPVLRLGVGDDVGVAPPAAITPDDDWISIRPQRAGYLITGSNPRSVLFAAYRYLEELGVRWLRPGSRGEIVPRLRSALPKKRLRLSETASYRYRTICIEGACSFEHVRDLIDWQTKRGLNGYLVQFDSGASFWQRWYQHPDNPHLKGRPFSLRDAARVVDKVMSEVRKRGLRFERMGHGWTCAPLGIAGEGWDEAKPNLTPDQRSMLAELNGKRDLFHGVPLNTNLCYSNPAVRAAMAGNVVAYARDHREVDALHIWLADGSNNNCECASCRRARPADFYVQLLNEIDAGLTAAGLPTRIVFLIYVDLMWPPAKTRLRNPNRFILMFAPITRSYARSFADARGKPARLADYVRNKLVFPQSAEDNLAYLRAWQQQFRGDGFDFDYHLIWACYYDLSHVTLARVLHRDIQSLGAIGLHGLSSCQNQRQSYPHNLAMDVMARTLWNKKLGFNGLARRSFADAFGDPRAERFFRQVSDLWKPFFEPVYTPRRNDRAIRQGLRNLPRLQTLVAQFRPAVRRGTRHRTPAVAWSWKYTAHYLDLLERLLPAFRAYLEASPDTRQRFELAGEFLRRTEKTVHPALDVSTCLKVFQWRVNELDEHRKKQVAGGQ